MRNRTLLRVLEREREAFAAERRLLLEQICHLSGRPWTPAPIDMREEQVDPEPVEPQFVHPDHWPES